uniref:Uncharacterized protein n=1 Tax=Anguilla anguilla TaxID=7936 RepID=A0A0E9QJE3_ANGAN
MKLVRIAVIRMLKTNTEVCLTN